MEWPAVYTDTQGAESTVIINDGETLRMSLRGIEFVGSSFDTFEPCENSTTVQLEQFSLHHGCLCSCRLEFQIPIPVDDHGSRIEAVLGAVLELGDPTAQGGLDREDLRLALHFNGQCFRSSGVSGGFFEMELLEIQSKMPAGTFMRACITCLYSDYSPYGNGLFGSMMCFRNLKSEYLKVRSKDDFWDVLLRHDRRVQETFLCEDFQRRVPGTGYRG